MSDLNFNVGDIVQSRRCPTLIGVVEAVPYEKDGVALVRVNERHIISPAAYWRRIRILKA